MSRETTRIPLPRLSALLSRLDPHAGGRCTVPGCVHDTAPARIGRFRPRPPRPSGRPPSTAPRAA
jgi:hypothetical protein